MFSTTRNQPPDADTSRPHHVVSTRCFVSRSVGSRLNVAIEDTRSDGDRMEDNTFVFASFFVWRVTEGYIWVHIPFITYVMLFKSEWCGCVENNKYILASRIMKHLANYSHQDYYICSKRSLFSLHLPQLLGGGRYHPRNMCWKKTHGHWGSEATILQQMPGSPSQYHEFNGVLNQKNTYLSRDMVHRQFQQTMISMVGLRL